MAGCGEKDLETIRANYNEWYTSMWAHSPAHSSWFDYTNQRLHQSYKHLTTADRPGAPARPAPLVGTTVSTLFAEIARVSQSLSDYAVGVAVYADMVEALKAADRSPNNNDELHALRACTRKIHRVPVLAADHNHREQLCLAFSGWSKNYFEWSSALTDWEPQLSAVPWPPWTDYQDEPA